MHWVNQNQRIDEKTYRPVLSYYMSWFDDLCLIHIGNIHSHVKYKTDRDSWCYLKHATHTFLTLRL